MEEIQKSMLSELLDEKNLSVFLRMTEEIDALYDMDRLWGKGFSDWVYEYKYRRGGKTLITFYAKKDCAAALIILGKAEREKFEAQAEQFSGNTRRIYNETQTYHDGKWIFFPVGEALSVPDIIRLLQLKRRPNRKQAAEKTKSV
ncbi:MAG: DUF3788 family protein [Clostridia bacterium]|nr:DUF3788 family protein [Clostridia bacterium]